jgi:tetratricopeptide (TPR) repeat protein
MTLTIELALQKAVEAHKMGNLKDAEALYRAILQAQPKHPDANHNLGVLAVSVNKPETALTLFKTALEANPNQGQFWISYIDALIKKKQFDNAETVLEQGKKLGLAGEKVDDLEAQLKTIFLAQNSEPSLKNEILTFTQQRKKVSAKKEKKKNLGAKKNSPNQAKSPFQAQVDLLLDQYQQGRYDLVENLAKTITQKYPNHQLSWKVLGAAFKKTGKLQESLAAGQKAVALVPNDAEAHNNLGITLQDLGRLEDAQASYRRAIAIEPYLAEAHSNLANMLQEIGKLEDAEIIYRKAIAIKPEYAQAHNNLGLTLQKIGKLKESETSYKKAIAIKPEYAEAHSNLGLTLQELGRLDEAEASHRKAIAIKPEHAEAHNNLGLTLQKLGKLKEAETSHKKAIAIKPEYAEAHSNLGLTLKELGRLDEAEASHKKAIAIKPELAEAHYNFGITLKEIGRLEEAETSYKKAIAIKPDFAEAHNNLGLTLQELGRFEGVETSYRKAIAIKPDFVEAHNNLGLTLLKLGRLEESETSYKIAIAIRPDYAEALFNLSLTLLFLDKLNETTQVLHNLITIDPDNLGLKACVNLAILSFLADDPCSSKLLLSTSVKILNNKKSNFKNEITYWRYLSLLLDRQKFKSQDKTKELEIQKLYVIGESHALTSHGLSIETSQNYYLCQSLWIIGCKQWHLGGPSENEYKYKFQKIIQSIPPASNILFAIGEIDCRLDDGILKYIKKNPNKNSRELITSTINNYLSYISKTLAPFSHKVIIQGVPCPNVNTGKASEQDVAELIDLIKEFNLVLKKQSLFFQFNFLDVHTITDRGDGFSNAKWHIDTHHISPEGMREAWRVSCLR